MIELICTLYIYIYIYAYYSYLSNFISIDSLVCFRLNQLKINGFIKIFYEIVNRITSHFIYMSIMEVCQIAVLRDQK